LNPRLALPRPLRALLVSINAHFDPRTHASRLQDQGDLQSMLDSLEQAGYVQAMPLSPNETVGFSASQFSAVEAAPTAPASSDLRDIVALITDFVMRNLPDQALEIVLDLEALSSKAQMEANLGSYQNRIRHLGGVATAHLTELRALLRPGAAAQG